MLPSHFERGLPCNNFITPGICGPLDGTIAIRNIAALGLATMGHGVLLLSGFQSNIKMCLFQIRGNILSQRKRHEHSRIGLGPIFFFIDSRKEEKWK